jgi:hypothetical protein
MSALTFEAIGHRYVLDGEPLRSVTGVLRDSGLIDFSHIPSATLEAARARGTAVHHAVHYFNEGDLDVAAFRQDFPECAGYLDAWIGFCHERRFEALINERRIASRIHRLAGTLDCLGVLDGHAVLLDFATGNPAECAKDLQTAGYLLLAQEWAAEDGLLHSFFLRHPVVRRYAVALRADGSCRVEPYTNRSDYRDFLALASARAIVEARRRRRPLAEVA